MPSCKQCSTAVLKLARQQTLAIAAPHNPQESSTPEEVWHPGHKFNTQNALRCWICAKFWSWLEVEHLDLYQNSHLTPIPMRFSVIGFMVIREKDSARITFDMDLDIGLTDVYTSGEVHNCCECSLFLAPVEAFSRDVRNFPVHKTLRSKIAVARRWINECQHKHTLCARGGEMWYPTRLLHINRQTGKVQLIISRTHSPTGPYLTLSHRWESVMRVKLLSSTMTEMQNEVAVSTLSQAFQDAIDITHHLGFSYLWIDALCIKQDEDELDWKIESQNMGDVYSNAFLNLSATRSFSGTEPLLSENGITSLAPSRVNVFDANYKDYYLLDNQIWRNEVDDAPLNQRGWVFQERYLARRILHFGSRQLAWECHETEALEAFPDGLPTFFSVQCMSKPRSYKPLRQSVQGHDNEIGTVINEFHRLVHNYSACQLTRFGDRLIAFSGIPKSMQESRKDFYVVGVWNQTLPFDLVWYRDELEQETCSAKERSLRGPSWSWASVRGAVNFPYVFAHKHEIHISEWRFIEPRKPQKGSAAYSTIIKLEGFLFPVEIEMRDSELFDFRIYGIPFRGEESELPGGPSLELDGPEEDVQAASRDGDLHWIPCFATNRHIYGLLVSKISRSGKFRRLGMIQVTLVNVFHSYGAGDVQEPDSRGRITRSKRRRLNGEENNAISKDSRGERLIKAIKKRERVSITLT